MFYIVDRNCLRSHLYIRRRVARVFGESQLRTINNSEMPSVSKSWLAGSFESLCG